MGKINEHLQVRVVKPGQGLAWQWQDSWRTCYTEKFTKTPRHGGMA
jgi:hypothetical protein